MRKLILHMGISIDGFVAAADGAHDWGYQGEDEAVKRWKLDSLWNAGAHLMGRITYEDMATVWPSSDSDYAAPMNEIPKVVFSKTLDRGGWSETRIASGDLDAEVAALKAEEGCWVKAGDSSRGSVPSTSSWSAPGSSRESPGSPTCVTGFCADARLTRKTSSSLLRNT